MAHEFGVVNRRRFLRQWLAGGLLLSVAQYPVSANDGAASLEERSALRDFLAASIAKAESFEDKFDAEVWLLDMQGRLEPFVGNHEQRLALLTLIHHEASASDLSPELVLALIEVESGFDRFAVSKAGAQGYMQVMPFWRDEIGRPSDNLINPKTNLSYGCRILQFYLQ